jgi:hypothetical protein
VLEALHNSGIFGFNSFRAPSDYTAMENAAVVQSQWWLQSKSEGSAASAPPPVQQGKSAHCHKPERCRLGNGDHIRKGCSDLQVTDRDNHVAGGS